MQRRSSNQSGSERPQGMQRGSSDRLKTMGVEPFPALTEEEMSSYPTRETRIEEEISQAPKYDDAHKGALKHGHVEEKAVKEKGEKGRPPSLERQVCLTFVEPGFEVFSLLVLLLESYLRVECRDGSIPSKP
jgi:hypothetical protein